MLLLVSFLFAAEAELSHLPLQIIWIVRVCVPLSWTIKILREKKPNKHFSNLQFVVALLKFHVQLKPWHVFSGFSLTNDVDDDDGNDGNHCRDDDDDDDIIFQLSIYIHRNCYPIQLIIALPIEWSKRQLYWFHLFIFQQLGLALTFLCQLKNKSIFEEWMNKKTATNLRVKIILMRLHWDVNLVSKYNMYAVCFIWANAFAKSNQFILPWLLPT